MNYASVRMAAGGDTAGRLRSRRSLSELAEAARLERDRLAEKLAQKQARLDKFDALQKERERKEDTRRKIVAGAVVLKHMEHDDAFAAAMHALLNKFVDKLPDRALFGLATIDPATGKPIETGGQGR